MSVSIDKQERNMLEVLISTLGRDGIARVADMTLPCVDRVGYVVSWQDPDGELPHNLVRPDVRVVLSRTIGLSNNRNDAFAASEAPLLLIADDDLDYTPEGLRAVIDTFGENDDVDIATFRHDGPDRKSYPESEHDLSLKFKNYYVTSFEIALRRRVVTGEGAVAFDPEFGIGAPRFQAGEEIMFILDALSAGFRCRFFPKTIVRHKGLTTAYRYLTPGVLRAQGAVVRAGYPWYSALLRLPVIAWRHYRAGRYMFLPSVNYLFAGWLHRRYRARIKLM